MTNKILVKKVATPYAEAFFQLGLILYKNQKKPELFFELIYDMQDFLQLLKDVPELAKFLYNPFYSPERKKNLLKNCVQQKLSVSTLEFFNLLIDKKRIHLIESIGKLFLDKAYAFVCIRFVEVWSMVKLSDLQEEALKKKIDFLLGPVFTTPYVQKANIQLLLKINENILGGLVIKIGSKVIDLSLQGELNRLEKLLKA